MSYRPITDTWILARSKVKYYGAYPAGFLSRARALLGVNIQDPVLHICSGKIKDYPYDGFGPNDKTLDLDESLSPDFVQSAVDAYPKGPWKAVLADPPYSVEDTTHYGSGEFVYPSPNDIVKRAIEAVDVGCRVGILHTIWPRYPKDIAKQVALVSVYVGNGNVGRTYAVYERIVSKSAMYDVWIREANKRGIDKVGMPYSANYPKLPR